jgi:ubiquinone/menaquinone biosynthesis C-methylase UbiE
MIKEEKKKKWRIKGAYYHKELEEYLKFIVPPDSSILMIGCENGDLLASLNPNRGVGIDRSHNMIEEARKNFPQLQFEINDSENFQVGEQFDYVVIQYAIGYFTDVQEVLKRLKKVCKPNGRMIVLYYNYLWEPIIKFAEAVGLKKKRPLLNWLSLEDIANLLYLNDFEVVKKKYRVLLPIYVPILSKFCNKILANLPFLCKLSLNEIIVARPIIKRNAAKKTTCSVIIPCRNEKGNIEEAVLKTPDMGKHTEIVFVEGHSTDGTLDECYRVKKKYSDRDITVLVQDGKGKGDAVRKGFSKAKNDVLMILDADLTVPPKDLPKFFDAVVSGKGQFINGSRLVYQMEDEAMRFLNLLGNKFFSLAFTYLLEQPIKDTLCGTKVLWRKDYLKIAKGREYFGNFDPFGDFDLLFGAAKLNLKIVEIPIKYRRRTYGTTQISRFRHGVLLLKMTFFALRKIKFV